MPLYMKIEGVVGSVTSKDYKGWMELQSAQFGVHRNIMHGTGSAQNRESAAPSVNEIVVTKFQDVSSVSLFRLAIDGKGKKVIIAFCRSDTAQTEYLRVEMENTLISSYSTGGGDSGHDRPIESLSLNFTKVEFISKNPK